MTDERNPSAGDEPAAVPPFAHSGPTLEPGDEPSFSASETAPDADPDAGGVDSAAATSVFEGVEAAEADGSSEGWTPAAPHELPPDEVPEIPTPTPTSESLDPASAPTEYVPVPPVEAPVPASIIEPPVEISPEDRADLETAAVEKSVGYVEPAMAPPGVAVPVVEETDATPPAPAVEPGIDGGGSWQEPEWVDRSAEEPIGLAGHDLASDDDAIVYPPYGDGAQQGPTTRRNLAVVVLAAVSAIALGFAAAFGIMLRNEHTLNSRRAGAIAESRAFAHDVTTYNYQHLDADFAKVLTHAAGKFQTDFADATKSSGQFVTLVKQLKATATGDVIATGVESVTKTKANVVVIVSQTVQNTNRPVAQAQRTEGRVDLQWIKGKWKVVDFHVL